MLSQRLSFSPSRSIPIFVTLFILTFVAVAALPMQAQTFTVLHKFKGPPDGGFPNGGVIVDSKGNLYGTTSEGGTGSCDGGCGTVFRLSPSGKVTILYSFTGTNGDGKYPQGGLVRDISGNFYGTTYGGGTSGAACDGYGCGTVFMMDSAGHETVLYSFSGGVDGATPEAGVVRDSKGNLYGTTKLGGLYEWGTVFMVDTSGTETVRHSFDGAMGDGGDVVGGLILDSAGMLFGTTQGGGIVNSHCLPGLEIGCGTVFQISTTGDETVLYDFSGHGDGNTPSGNVARDNAGNLYGTSQPQPTVGYGTIFKLDAAGGFIVLHTFTGGAGGADPFAGLVRDSAGNLYGTTYQGGGGGATCQTFDGGCGIAFELSPTGKFSVLHSFTGGADGGWLFAPLALDSKGNLYGTASIGGVGDGTVFKITP